MAQRTFTSARGGYPPIADPPEARVLASLHFRINEAGIRWEISLRVRVDGKWSGLHGWLQASPGAS